jgi:hypothetical protein
MPQSLEDLVEQFREEGLSESEAIKAAKKRFLEEAKAKPKSRMQVADKKSYNNLIKKQLQKQQEKNKINKNKKNIKIKTIKAKQGGSIGNKFVASIYGGCN